MGVRHLSVEAATAHLSLSVKEVSCFRLAFWLCLCLWSQTQRFQTDVPRASEIQCVFVSSGSWGIPVLQERGLSVKQCVILFCRGKQVFNISGKTEIRELWGW